MNVKELNEFIKDYFKKNKTRSAIMLSAPWGTGKSYYISKHLIPYLKNKCKIDCIVLSLYGLINIDEISKGIFLESKASFLSKKNTAFCSTKIIAKTIVKGITSFFGIDLKTDENDLKELYESIDLTDKLIIFEDVERTKINIIELLGFINNLVEEDNVKVLLVTNEDELIKRQISDNSNYFNVKEKTISDTIQFHLPTKEAIINIINSFKIKFKKNDIKNELIDEVEMLMVQENCHNLRSFIFACQKTKDILEKLKFDVNDEFKKSIFLSNVAFCLKKKKNDNIKWEGLDYLSSDLGTSKYPLYKFSYDYIIFQSLDLDEIKKQYDLFLKLIYDKNIKDTLKPLLDTIYSYYLQSESDVKNAVNLIEEKLEKTNDVPYSEYGRLANYLIAIKYDIDECASHIENCKKIMLLKINNATSEDFKNIRFHHGLELESKEAIDELNNFKNQLYDKNNERNNNLFNFDYSLDKINLFCLEIYKNKDSFITKRCFARKLNNKKFVELLKKCNPAQMDELRAIFRYVYSFSNIKDFYAEDKDSLEDLKNKIEDLLANNNNFDLIQKKQLNYLISNLKNIIDKLS